MLKVWGLARKPENLNPKAPKLVHLGPLLLLANLLDNRSCLAVRTLHGEFMLILGESQRD